MDCQLEHIGYVTDDIAKTAASFRLLGYVAGDIVSDDTQRTRICFLRKQILNWLNLMRTTRPCRKC